jgi:hypothetical protein
MRLTGTAGALARICFRAKGKGEQFKSLIIRTDWVAYLSGEGAGAPSEKVEFAVTALEFKLPSPLLSAAALGAWESRFSPDIIDPRTITVIT